MRVKKQIIAIIYTTLFIINIIGIQTTFASSNNILTLPDNETSILTNQNSKQSQIINKIDVRQDDISMESILRAYQEYIDTRQKYKNNEAYIEFIQYKYLQFLHAGVLFETEHNNIEKNDKQYNYDYDYTTIWVETDNFDIKDEQYVTYQDGNAYVLSLPDEKTATGLMNKYQTDMENEVSYDIYLEPFDTGEDDYRYLSWGAEAIGITNFNQSIMGKYHDVSVMPQINIAVIDTGVDYNHPFLKSRITEAKYDYYDNDDDPMDEHGHGTHVAGIIVDTTLENVNLYVYKLSGVDGKISSSNLVKAVRQAIADNVDIMNLSLGATVERNSTNIAIKKMYEALDDAYQHSIIIVAASGNNGADAATCFPGNYENAITVASYGKMQRASSFSNYGEEVLISAPGETIYSTVPDNSYANKRGTSMAAPYVTAAIAMIKTENPFVSKEDIMARLIDTAFDFDENGYDIYLGYGGLNMNTQTSAPKSETIQENDKEYIELIPQEYGTEIYYTLDGSIPDTSNATQLYTNKIPLTSRTKITFVAKNQWLEDSKPVMLTGYTIGDVNDDKIVNSDDAVLVLRYYAGLLDATKLNILAADVNQDKLIDSDDVLWILRYYAGIIQSFQ